eukprot:2997184-Alexandrium_andersonii.AAC.1
MLASQGHLLVARVLLAVETPSPQPSHHEDWSASGCAWCHCAVPCWPAWEEEPLGFCGQALETNAANV